MDQATTSPDVRQDSEIVDRVRRGDVQAYGALVERYEWAVLAAVLPVVRDVHAAQDVVQDVFVRCYTQLGSLRDASRFGPWLLRAAGREAVRASRRARRMRIVSPPNDADVAAEPEEPLLSDEREQLLRCVQSLPAHERLAVSMRYFQGCGVHEIAHSTGLGIGTVTKQLSRALSRLRDQLKRESKSWPSTMKSNASPAR